MAGQVWLQECEVKMVLARKREKQTEGFEPSKNMPGTGDIKASPKQVRLQVQGSWEKDLTEKKIFLNQGRSKTSTNE